MRILVIYNSKNTPDGGNDANGAFIPEAILFERRRKALGDTVQRIPFDNLLPTRQRAAAFLGLMEKADAFDVFVYLGHGLRNSLVSAQIGAAQRPDFCRLLQKKAIDKTRMVVTLYACSTGETPRTIRGPNGDGGFADLLRDDLEALGFTSGWVDGHTTAAHATNNPYTRRFDLGPESNIGGEWLVEPKSPDWERWRARLKARAKDDPFRFDFPYMTAAEIRAAVRST